MKEKIKENVLNKAIKVDQNLLREWYPMPSRRSNFIANCALTFGLQLETLAVIFGKTEWEMRNYLLKADCVSSLNRLFYSGVINQEEAIANFNQFYTKLTDAYNNGQKVKDILAEIYDYKVYEFKKNHKAGQSLSTENIMMLMKYQVKHLISTKEMGLLFNFNPGHYRRQINKINYEVKNREIKKLLANDYSLIDKSEKSFKENTLKRVYHG